MTRDELIQVLDLGGVARLREIFVEQHWQRKRDAAANPLLKAGAKYFSQNDEDGILLEILRRIGRDKGVFVELGVGNGLENNTLILLLGGWRGVWVDAQPLAFNVPRGGPLAFQQAWVSRENCASLVAHGLQSVGGAGANVLSVDIDGNDLHVTRALLEAGHSPDVVIVEYNGKFPPPMRWSVQYDPDLRWDGNDYQGASLQSFVDLLGAHQYRLVACNITGVNAFFVRNALADRFADVPAAVDALFMRPDYNWFVGCGHATSPLTVGRYLEQQAR